MQSVCIKKSFSTINDISEFLREIKLPSILCNTNYIHVENSLQFTSYFRKLFFSLHDANLIGPYKIIYNVYDTIHHPLSFSFICVCRRLKRFKFCNKLVFWIVGNCSTLFKCSWCAINKRSLLLHWGKNCWSVLVIVASWKS